MGCVRGTACKRAVLPYKHAYRYNQLSTIQQTHNKKLATSTKTIIYKTEKDLVEQKTAPGWKGVDFIIHRISIGIEFQRKGVLIKNEFDMH